MSATWNLTEQAQKQVSMLSKKIEAQKLIIAKEQAVVDSQEDSYICKRAKNALENLDAKMSKLDDDLEKKKKELTDAYNEMKKKYAYDMQQAEENRERLEKELETKRDVQLSIIKAEKEKKSRLIIKAEKEIEILQEEKNKVVNASRPTPIVVPATVSKNECEEYESVTVNMADLFHEGRLDGKPLGPSYIHSYYYAEPKAPGKRTTVYGAVSEIAKGKKAGESFPA
jgi:phage-related minor tail protein